MVPPLYLIQRYLLLNDGHCSPSTLHIIKLQVIYQVAYLIRWVIKTSELYNM